MRLYTAAVVSAPDSLAWLLNIRGGDLPRTPFALGFDNLDRAGAAGDGQAAQDLPGGAGPVGQAAAHNLQPLARRPPAASA